MVSEYANRSLWVQSRTLLSTTYLQPAATFVHFYFSESQIEEHLEACTLYNYCLNKFPNHLSFQLCRLYLCSDYDPQTRTRSITLLLDLINKIDDKDGSFSPKTIKDLKPVLVSCLRLQDSPESDFKILLDIVSAMCVHVFGSEDEVKWDELRDYMAVTIDSDFRKVFRLFCRLPAILDAEFLMVLSGKLFSAIVEKLTLCHGDSEDWDLAFKSGFAFGVHMIESPRNDLSKNMLYELTRSAFEIVKDGKEGILKRTLEDLAKLVQKEVKKYYPTELAFVSELLRMIGGIKGMRIDVKKVARNISQVIKENVLKRSEVCAS